MREAVGAALVGLFVFLLFADETPASLLSRLTVLFNGPDYAARIFQDHVPIVRVLASDDTHPLDRDAPRCQVAVVELAPEAPAEPPPVPLIEQDSSRFGGSWRPTPLRPGPLSMPDLMALCGDRIDFLTRRVLVQAMTEPGAFVIRDWKNDVLQIYAPNHALAAHLSRKVASPSHWAP